MNHIFELIRNDIIEICNSEYEASRRGKNLYYIARNQPASRVKQDILSKLKPEYAKLIYVDSLMYILDLKGNTFITIT